MTGLEYRIENPSCRYCLYSVPSDKTKSLSGVQAICECIVIRNAIYTENANSCECYYPDPRDIKALDDMVEG